MEHKRLTPAFHIKFDSVDAKGEFSGYASTFGGPPDAYGEVIAPGAFTESLKSGQMPALLWQHNPAEPIGVWLDMVEDAKGLWVRGRLTTETQRGAEACALMRAGALNGLSIGFVPKRWEDSDSGIRTLTEIELWETSIVTFPANSNARVSDVKSIRDYESLLRDELGFSVRQAKKLASGGWAALDGRDDPNEAEELAAAMQTRARELANLIGA